MIGSIKQNPMFLQQVAVTQMQNNNEVFKKTSGKEEKVETSRAQQIKEALAKGEYKINIGGSAEKMARNLLGKW